MTVNELFPADLPKPTPRAFVCPKCSQLALYPGPVGKGVAVECVACGYSTNDLLKLVPTQPVGLVRVAVGEGWLGMVRVVAFIWIVASLLTLILAGR